MTVLEQIGQALSRPLQLLFDPGQRLFWPYLGVSLLVAVVITLANGRHGRLSPEELRRPERRLLEHLFARRVWLHSSSLLDVQLLVVKGLFKVLLIAPLLFSASAVAVRTFLALDGWLGARAPLPLSRASICALYTVALFVAWDFSRYLLHRLMHRVPALWELHKVHHSARVMTPLTLYRGHPIESYLFMLRGALVTGLVTGLFMHLARGQATQLDFVGVNAVGFVFNLAGGNLRHSHVRLRYPRVLERLLISPAQHQIHHSSAPREHHSNFGSWLAIWDWIGGSLSLSRPGQRLRYGLPDEELNHRVDGLGSALWRPLVAALRALVPRRRRADETPAAASR